MRMSRSAGKHLLFVKALSTCQAGRPMGYWLLQGLADRVTAPTGILNSLTESARGKYQAYALLTCSHACDTYLQFMLVTSSDQAL
jgi:hypothetical protein